jgi:hypothetical protein
MGKNKGKKKPQGQAMDLDSFNKAAPTNFTVNTTNF